MSDETDPFVSCETLAEVLLVVHAMEGLSGVARVLTETDSTRESLRDAANQFKRVGMTELADLVKLIAKKAKRAPPSWAQRHHQGERRTR
jgi:hypothetical protein